MTYSSTVPILYKYMIIPLIMLSPISIPLPCSQSTKFLNLTIICCHPTFLSVCNPYPVFYLHHAIHPSLNSFSGYYFHNDYSLFFSSSSLLSHLGPLVNHFNYPLILFLLPPYLITDLGHASFLNCFCRSLPLLLFVCC